MAVYGCVIPVAGLSSRMGAFKPLLPVADNQVMIERTVGQVLSAGVGICVVVLGFKGDLVKAKLMAKFPKRFIFLENRDYATTDMLTSIQLGLNYLQQTEVTAAFILPGDMPCVDTRTFETLMAAFNHKKATKKILFPSYDGKRKHPPLISRNCFEALLTFDQEGGLRAFFDNSERHIQLLEINDQGCCYDADTPAEFANLKKYLRS